MSDFLEKPWRYEGMDDELGDGEASQPNYFRAANRTAGGEHIWGRLGYSDDADDDAVNWHNASDGQFWRDPGYNGDFDFRWDGPAINDIPGASLGDTDSSSEYPYTYAMNLVGLCLLFCVLSFCLMYVFHRERLRDEAAAESAYGTRRWQWQIPLGNSSEFADRGSTSSELADRGSTKMDHAERIEVYRRAFDQSHRQVCLQHDGDEEEHDWERLFQSSQTSQHPPRGDSQNNPRTTAPSTDSSVRLEDPLPQAPQAGVLGGSSSSNNESSSSSRDSPPLGPLHDPLAVCPTCPSREEALRTTCIVCFEDFRAGDTVVWSQTSSCRHVYHKDCLVSFFAHRNQTVQSIERDANPCPVCRRPFVSVYPSVVDPDHPEKV